MASNTVGLTQGVGSNNFISSGMRTQPFLFCICWRFTMIPFWILYIAVHCKEYIMCLIITVCLLFIFCKYSSSSSKSFISWW